MTNSVLETNSRTKLVHIILNASSGLEAKKQAPEVLTGILNESGCEAHIKHVDKGTDLCALTRELIRDGADIIVAAGGDGTVNAVASEVAGTDVALGIIPAGTLNHFARDLNIPFDFAEAARVIAGAHEVRVDIGEVNGRRFINNAIIGLYPVYRFQRDRHEKHGRNKWLAILSAVRSVFRLNPAFHPRIEAEGQVLDRRTPFLMIANNRHEMSGYNLGTRESLSEGKLYLYMMHRMSRMGLLRLAVQVLFGRFSKLRDFDLLSAREITLESRRKRIGISLDGEVIRMSTPLRYKSLPGALRVIVPAPSQ